MDAFADELLEHIFSFLDKEGLWAVVRVSSRLRRLGLLPLLQASGVSSSDMDSGTLVVPDWQSLHLVLVMAQVVPIKKLVFAKEFADIEFDKLVSILRLAPPIPHIMIHHSTDYFTFLSNSTKMSGKTTAQLLAHIPSSAKSDLLIVHGDSMGLLHPKSERPNPLQKLLLFDSRPESIEAEKDVLEFDHWMRIQTLSLPGKNERLALVTLKDWGNGGIAIQRVPGLAHEDAVYSALLASLELDTAGKSYLMYLTVDAQLNLDYSDVMTFIGRHDGLAELTFGEHSIRPSSLVKMSFPKTRREVGEITTPAMYVPFLLATELSVQQVRVSFPSLTGRQFDTHVYRAALDAIALLPSDSEIRFTFTFPFPRAPSLPWMVCTADSHAPEARLHCVSELTLSVDAGANELFNASDIRLLVPWLGLFPKLRAVLLKRDAFEQLGADVRRELAAAICAACPSIFESRDVIFNAL